MIVAMGWAYELTGRIGVVGHAYLNGWLTRPEYLRAMALEEVCQKAERFRADA